MQTDLIFYQVAATSPIIWSDQAHDYVRIDGVWRVPRSGDTPEFYTPIDAWPHSHAGQLAGLSDELARHLAELERRNETILAQARELRELRDQVAQLREQQQQQPAEAPLATVAEIAPAAEAWRCVVEGCTHSERSLISPDYCFTHAAKLASTQPAEPPKPAPLSLPTRADLPCPHCDKRGLVNTRALNAHLLKKHGIRQQKGPSDAELLEEAELAKRRRLHDGPPEPIPASTYEPPPTDRIGTFICSRCGSDAFAQSVGDSKVCVRCVKAKAPAEPTAIAAAA